MKILYNNDKQDVKKLITTTSNMLVIYNNDKQQVKKLTTITLIMFTILQKRQSTNVQKLITITSIMFEVFKTPFDIVTIAIGLAPYFFAASLNFEFKHQIQGGNE